MRLLITTFALILMNFCFGQSFKLVETKTESFYKIITDSIDIESTYPDGRYKAFATDTDQIPKHVFHLQFGKVDGPYLELGSCGWSTGNYHEDSLWTFLTNAKDTTFKIGTWRNYICGLDIYETKQYKMPFDSEGVFMEVWYFNNGNKARQAFFKKGFGLEKEIYWDFETSKVSKQVINSGSKNYSETIIYENDSISFVSLLQNGVEVQINYNNLPFDKQSNLDINVYSDNLESDQLPITTLSIDSTNTLYKFIDVKRQIFLREDKDGNVSIEYVTSKGKRKSKKIKKRVK